MVDVTEFTAFCGRQYPADGGTTTKALRRNKACRIVDYITGIHEEKSSFGNWVRKRGFDVKQFPHIGLENVLCQRRSNVQAGSETSDSSGDADHDLGVFGRWRRVVVVEEFHSILQEAHTKAMNHGGYKVLLREIERNYACIPRSAVQTFVNMCSACQLQSRQITKAPSKPMIAKTLSKDLNGRCHKKSRRGRMGRYVIEVCVDSAESALAAQRGGATRVELCANLLEGGTTPSLGLLQVIKKECPDLPVYVLIRPRGGDFLYSDLEFEVMKYDVQLAKDNGADGFVFGILTSAGHVDKERCRELAEVCQPLPTTFHRAFDVCQDPYSALEDIISLGFKRLLTSGQDSSVLEGLPLIGQLVKHSKGRIIVMPGGGISERNLSRILDGSRATEFHCSARTSCQSAMTFRNTSVPMGAALRPPEFSVKYADENLIRRMIGIAADRL